MKKISILTALIAAFSFVSSASNATGFYVGADALFSSASFNSKSNLSVSAPQDGDNKDGDNIGLGLNLGYRFDLLNLYTAAEVFYDHLDVSATGFNDAYRAPRANDSLNVNNRYGVKGHVGAAILPFITPFFTLGMANVDYDIKINSSNSSVGKTELSPLYGLGVLVDLPIVGLSARASYDYQDVNMDYVDATTKINTDIHTVRLGIAYNF